MVFVVVGTLLSLPVVGIYTGVGLDALSFTYPGREPDCYGVPYSNHKPLLSDGFASATRHGSTPYVNSGYNCPGMPSRRHNFLTALLRFQLEAEERPKR